MPQITDQFAGAIIQKAELTTDPTATDKAFSAATAEQRDDTREATLMPRVTLYKEGVLPRSLAADDLGYRLDISVAGTITIPAGLAVGFNCSIVNRSTGSVTIQAASTVSINEEAGGEIQLGAGEAAVIDSLGGENYDVLTPADGVDGATISADTTQQLASVSLSVGQQALLARTIVAFRGTSSWTDAKRLMRILKDVSEIEARAAGLYTDTASGEAARLFGEESFNPTWAGMRSQEQVAFDATNEGLNVAQTDAAQVAQRSTNQAAIKAQLAIIEKVGAGTVEFPSGTIVLDVETLNSVKRAITLVGARRIRFKGQGEGRTVLKILFGAHGASNVHLFQLEDCEDLVFQDLTFDADRTNLTGERGVDRAEQRHVFNATGCRNIYFIRCTFVDSCGDGFRSLRKAPDTGYVNEHLYFIDCVFDSAERSGISMREGTRFVYIIRCQFASISDQAVSTEPAGEYDPQPVTDVWMVDCVIDGNHSVVANPLFGDSAYPNAPEFIDAGSSVPVAFDGIDKDHPCERIYFVNTVITRAKTPNAMEMGRMKDCYVVNCTIEGGIKLFRESPGMYVINSTVEFTHGDTTGGMVNDEGEPIQNIGAIYTLADNAGGGNWERVKHLLVWGGRITVRHATNVPALRLFNIESFDVGGGLRAEALAPGNTAAGIDVPQTSGEARTVSGFAINGATVKGFQKGARFATTETYWQMRGVSISGLRGIGTTATTMTAVVDLGNSTWSNPAVAGGVPYITDTWALGTAQQVIGSPGSPGVYAISGNPGDVAVYVGRSAPSGVVLAARGSLYLLRESGGSGQVLWLKVGDDTAATKWIPVGPLYAEVNHDPPEIADGETYDFNVPLVAATTEMAALATFAGTESMGWRVEAKVTGAGMVTVRLTNGTGGSLNLPNGKARVWLFQDYSG